MRVSIIFDGFLLTNAGNTCLWKCHEAPAACASCGCMSFCLFEPRIHRCPFSCINAGSWYMNGRMCVHLSTYVGVCICIWMCVRWYNNEKRKMGAPRVVRMITEARLLSPKLFGSPESHSEHSPLCVAYSEARTGIYTLWGSALMPTGSEQ